MSLFSKRTKPKEVFTPRASTVNDQMYVDRTELERVLKKHCQGSKHIIIHGESGNGKTWLYKKVFGDLYLPYLTINLANASRFGSFQNLLKEKLKSDGPDRELSQIVIQKQGGMNAAVLSANYTDERIYSMVERDPLLALMILLNRQAAKKQSLIVLENFEQILDQASIVKEISDTLILLDDDDYAKYNVRFCIVGVPSEIREYLGKQAAIETISNRVVEVPEVARLAQSEAEALLRKGFKIINLECSEEIIKEIVWKTDRIAQHLHELGLEVSELAIENSEVIDASILKNAISSWISNSFSAIGEVVDSHLNSRATKAGRKNQVIYCLGTLTIEDFKYSDVEERVREVFPDSTKGITLNISQILSKLSDGNSPLIKRVPKGDAYRFVNPKVKIEIRVQLHLTEVGKVVRKPRTT